MTGEGPLWSPVPYCCSNLCRIVAVLSVSCLLLITKDGNAGVRTAREPQLKKDPHHQKLHLGCSSSI